MILKVLSLLVTAITATALALFAPQFDFTVGKAADPVQLAVTAKNLELICAGPAYRTGGESGTNVGSFDEIDAAAVIGTSGGGLLSQSISKTSPIFANQGAQGEGSTMLNANQTQLVASPRMNGLTAAACQRADNEQWLVGGDTTTGREALLLLANTGSVDSTVNLEIYSEAGQVKAPGLTGISVANHSTLVVPLASLIPKTKTFVTRVLSTGGAIAAFIQQKAVRGLSAQGVDLITPSSSGRIEFAKRIAIAGILVRGAKDALALQANADYLDLTPVLRVFVPGDQPATITGQIFGSNAKTFGTVVRETIAAKSVKDIPITGISDGDYAALIDANQEITASIRLVRTKGKQTDFTWLGAGEQFTNERTVTVPATGITKLAIVNPNSTATVVKLNGSTINIAASSTAVLKVENSSKVILSADLPIAANLIVDVSGAVANIPVLDYRNAGAKLKIRVR